MTPKNKTYLISGIFLVAALALFGFCIYPLFLGIKDGSQDIIKAKKKVLLLKQEGNEIRQFKELYKSYRSDLEKSEQLFIDPATPLKFIKFLEDNSSKSNIPIEISSIQYPKEKEKSDFVIFQINSWGSFSSFLKFLGKIETSSYLIESQNLTIRKLTEREVKNNEFSLGDVEINFRIKVFAKPTDN